MQENKKYFYEAISEKFDELAHPYDTHRRVEIVCDEELGQIELQNKWVLDAGCGPGHFSVRLKQKGAQVVALDISFSLTRLTIERCRCRGVVGDAESLPFKDSVFDIVISSEMIEHTPSPEMILRELCRVLKHGGLLVITTPNRSWQWIVRCATKTGLRPFRGYENFLHWKKIEDILHECGMTILRHRGFHPWPFQLKAHRFAKKIDAILGETWWGRMMVNQCLTARKNAYEHRM